MKNNFKAIENILVFIFIALVGKIIGELLNYVLDFMLIGFLDKEAINAISNILEIFLVIYFYSILFDLKNICKFKKIKISTSLFIILNAISTNAIIYTFLSVIDSKFMKLTPVITINTTNNANIILALVLAIFIIPVFEEILFRGLILNELRKYFNLGTSVLTQALIFGLVHFNLVQTIYTFMAGIVLALLYIWTESIYSTYNMSLYIQSYGDSNIPSYTHIF